MRWYNEGVLCLYQRISILIKKLVAFEIEILRYFGIDKSSLIILHDEHSKQVNNK